MNVIASGFAGSNEYWPHADRYKAAILLRRRYGREAVGIARFRQGQARNAKSQMCVDDWAAVIPVLEMMDGLEQAEADLRKGGFETVHIATDGRDTLCALPRDLDRRLAESATRDAGVVKTGASFAVLPEITPRIRSAG